MYLRTQICSYQDPAPITMTEAIRQEIINFAPQDISQALIDSFKYEGFDTVYLFGRLKAKEPSVTVFTKDMNVLCLVGMMRGTLITKIMDSMSAAGKTELGRLKNKYVIKDKVGAASKKETITIGRIMSIFPQICLHHCAQGNVRNFGVSGSFSLPEHFRFPQFASLIPSTNADLMEQFVIWSVAVDGVISGEAGNREKVSRFAQIQQSNSIFPDEQREILITPHL